MYIVTVNINNKLQEIVSLLSPEIINQKQIPSQAIIGMLSKPLGQNEQINLNNFIPNQPFVDFLHTVIAKYAPQIPELQDRAEKQGKGWVYIIDARCPNLLGRILPEDIIGSFNVKNGQISSESYQKNKEHLILSCHGFFKLESRLQKCLIEEVKFFGSK